MAVPGLLYSLRGQNGERKTLQDTGESLTGSDTDPEILPVVFQDGGAERCQEPIRALIFMDFFARIPGKLAERRGLPDGGIVLIEPIPVEQFGIGLCQTVELQPALEPRGG